MRPKKSIAPGPLPSHRLSEPRFRPRVVFARDEATGGREAPAEPARVLIVEDDFLIASEIEAALAEAGYHVVGVAPSADEAAGMAAAERPDLAVMDIRLSGKRDGIDAALELFAKHGLRCIFATAHHNAEVRNRAAPAQPLAWIAKPYSMPSLVEAVRTALRDLRNPKS